MAYLGNSQFQGIISGGNIQDGSIESIDLATLTNIDINSGSIDNTIIGANEAVAGNFSSIGIGTNSPNAGLQISKGADQSPPAAGSNTAAACFGNNTSDNAYGLVMGADGFGKGYISAQRTDGTATTYDLVIQPNGGNVGIGTASPWESLSLPFNKKISLGSSTYPFSISRDSAGVLTTTFADSYDASNSRIDFVMREGSVNENTALSITGAGSVGIGTSSPGAKLHVWNPNGGNATDKATMLSEAVVKLQPHSTNSTNLLVAQVNNGNGMGLQVTNSSATADWDIALSPFGGNVGIGNTNPSTKLEITASNSGNNQLLKITGNTSVAGEYTSILLHSTNGPEDWYGSEIRNVNTGSSPGYLQPKLSFFTQDTNTYLPSGRTEKMSIAGNGDVNITTGNLNLSAGSLKLNGSTILSPNKYNLYLNSSNAGNGNGIFFRDGFGIGNYNCSITVQDHNGSFPDGIHISGYDGVTIGTGSNEKVTRVKVDQAGNTNIYGDLTISGNGKELNFSGGNNRIKFSGYRGLEGSTNGDHLQLGEQYTRVSCYGDLHILSGSSLAVNHATPVASLDVVGSSLVKSSYADVSFNTSVGWATNGNAGEITIVLQANGTIPSGDVFEFIYDAQSWKAWQIEVTISNTTGFAHYIGGGYNNGGYGGYLTEISDPNNTVSSATGSSYGSGNQGNKFQFGLRAGGVHTTIKIKYSQGGGDGAPRADRCYARVGNP